MGSWPWSKAQTKVFKLRKPVEQHLGCDLTKAQSVKHEIKPFEHIDLQRSVDRWVAESGSAVQEFGYTAETAAKRSDFRARPQSGSHGRRPQAGPAEAAFEGLIKYP